MFLQDENNENLQDENNKNIQEIKCFSSEKIIILCKGMILLNLHI